MSLSPKVDELRCFANDIKPDLIAELARRSPIIIQNGSCNQSSRKNLDLRPFDRPYKVLLLTCVFNCTATALSRSPVVSTLGSESDDPGSSPGRGKALCP